MRAATTTGLTGKRYPGTRIFAAFGLIWSLFGADQFATATFSDADRLVSSGLTPEQAMLYAMSPPWMDTAFALGTFGGIIGSALLLFRRRMAAPVLAASLAGYLVLYIGDIATGVFDAFGAPHIAVLTSVVAIAAALVWMAHRSNRAG